MHAVFAALLAVVCAWNAPSSTTSPVARAGHMAIVGEWVVRGVQQPVSFDFDPRGRIWFVEKGVGDVLVFDPRTGTTHRFFHVTDLITDSEQGLDGIALDPRFPETPYVYLFATRLVRGRPTDQILRVTAGTPGSREVDVIYASLASPLHQHSGGRLIFGPDGMLYVTIGDASDPGAAQDIALDQREDPRDRPRMGRRRRGTRSGRVCGPPASATRSAWRSIRSPATCGRPRTVRSATTS